MTIMEQPICRAKKRSKSAKIEHLQESEAVYHVRLNDNCSLASSGELGTAQVTCWDRGRPARNEREARKDCRQKTARPYDAFAGGTVGGRLYRRVHVQRE